MLETMGKKKGSGKKLHVFKVAGAKSLKAKSKAKPVTGNLKKINEIVRKNVNDIDKKLVSLESDLRNKKKVDTKRVFIEKKKDSNKKGQECLEKEKQEALEKLSKMEF